MIVRALMIIYLYIYFEIINIVVYCVLAELALEKQWSQCAHHSHVYISTIRMFVRPTVKRYPMRLCISLMEKGVCLSICVCS